MSLRELHEPDKNLSAVQAFLLMAALTAPLVWSVSFRTTVVTQPIVVAVVAAPPPEPEPAPQPEADLERVREQLEATRRNLEEAEVARRRAQQQAEERRREEEVRQAEEDERRREEEQARQRELEEEQRRKEAEEEKRRQAEAERRREEERRKLEEEERRRREAEEIERRRVEAEARAKAARDARLMDRHIAGIHDRVKRHLTNPEGVPSGIQVEVRVLLQPNGTLADIPKVIEESGFEPFDDQAVRAVIRGAENGFDLPDDPELREQFDELILVITPKE